MLITGGARRIGAATALHFHQLGYNLIVHYCRSGQQALALCEKLNQMRPNSATALQGDLEQQEQVKILAQNALDHWGRINVLVNNASAFYPTPVGETSEQHWNDLFASNAKAPFFLSQYLHEPLGRERGCIINMIDITALQPLARHTVYCMAKAALYTMTKSLAKELAPNIRVNGIAPGAILWPDNNMTEAEKEKIRATIPMKKSGTPDDIARTIQFLVEDAPYITGQVIAVDGGRSLSDY